MNNKVNGISQRRIVTSPFFLSTHTIKKESGRNALQTHEFFQKGPCGGLYLNMISWLEGNEVRVLLVQPMTWFFSSELASVGDFISSHWAAGSMYWLVSFSFEGQFYQRRSHRNAVFAGYEQMRQCPLFGLNVPESFRSQIKFSSVRQKTYFECVYMHIIRLVQK